MLALTLLGVVATTATAQVTTTVFGSVKDAQGGVLPGATVTLTSETRGTKADPVTTNATGDFVFPSVTPDTYTLQVEMPAFKTLQRKGLVIGSDPRIALGTLTLDIGGAQEVVSVTAEAALIQSASGERSFTIDRQAVESLPIANRSLTGLAALAPGVDGTTRVGGGGDTNITMDGASTSSPGNNATMLQLNTESVAEVRILTSGYQAEFGRASGLQVTAVTKGGSNQFHGAVYDIERNSDWNANSKVNKLNGDPKTVLKERDFGFTLGGPVGRPGGSNRIFFFVSHEISPRKSGNNVVRYRLPTALERIGDFSQSTDNNGALYNLIKNPNSTAACTAANTAGCYADGSVVGRIPASALYAPGMALLNMYPLPNIANPPAGQAYNFELTRPVEKLTGTQTLGRVDYQPLASLRGSYRYAVGRQPGGQVFNGTLPGFNDALASRPFIPSQAVSVNYSLRPNVVIEGTYGRVRNELSNCGAGGRPVFCNNGWPAGPLANANTAGIGGIPLIFPDGRVVNPDFYTFRAMEKLQLPMWDGTRLLLPPQFQWGSRVANANTPPGNLLTGFYNSSIVEDFSASVTIVKSRHTIKAGIFNLSQFQAQITGGGGGAIGTLSFANDAAGINPFDTSFGFANAATGAFSSYSQASRLIEYNSRIRNTDFYIQDNWKVNGRLTVDAGLRFVHQVPDYDKFLAASNFLPELWSIGSAPLLYQPGCANGVSPCTGTNRQARHPVTGAFLGTNSAVLIGTLVPNTGDPLNGLRKYGEGIVDTGYIWPAIAIAPRFGAAYDLTGTQKIVVRGSGGLFFDRTAANSTRAAGTNPPISENVTLRYASLQNLTGGLSVKGAPVLGGAWEYEPDGLPSSMQWNLGAQIALPYAAAFDVSYVGQHSYLTNVGTNINAVDFGAGFLDANLDRTQAGNPALAQDLLRAIRGYGAITQNIQNGWRTFHSIQFSLNRRFRNGISFGLNDTWSLYDHQSTAPRLEHNADGTFRVRADQAEADKLLGTTVNQVHLLRGNLVWDLPDVRGESSLMKTLGYIANDWQLSSIWSGRTGTPYTVGFTYQNGGGNLNLTGSPDYAARVKVTGDPGDGCSGDVYRQFNTAAFQGPAVGSVGLESGNDYLRGCFTSTIDLSLARNIRLGRGQSIQIRADMFNAPNSAIITGRVTNMNLANPSDPTTITNLPFDASGNLVTARSLPRGGGFGIANDYQDPRTVQLTVRYTF